MIAAHGTQNYREADVRSMPREKLVVLLYEKMIRDLDEATTAHANGNSAVSIDRVSHSLQILTELLQALDPSHDETLAGNLASLYEFMIHQHHRFLADRDGALLDDCQQVIKPLLNAWREAARTAEAPAEQTTRPDEASHRLFSVSA